MTILSPAQVTVYRFTPDRTITPEKQAWAAATLADLPTLYRFRDDLPVKLATDETGTTCRQAFAITLSPADDGGFTVHLHAGASSTDLDRAHRIISGAKAGLFNSDMWRQRDDGTWICRKWWERRDVDHLDELRECEESACSYQWHEWVGGEQFMACELEAIRTDAYIITGYRFGGSWVAGASLELSDSTEGPAGLKLLRDLTNDYAWMLGECERLNQLAEKRAAV